MRGGELWEGHAHELCGLAAGGDGGAPVVVGGGAGMGGRRGGGGGGSGDGGHGVAGARTSVGMAGKGVEGRIAAHPEGVKLGGVRRGTGRERGRTLCLAAASESMIEKSVGLNGAARSTAC